MGITGQKGKKQKGKIGIRKHLNSDAIHKRLHKDFSEVSDFREDPDISNADALMSGFAMFSLKDPSLLAFDGRRKTHSNLGNIYHIGKVPCDSQMRTILDEVSPEELRKPFTNIFWELQRGKVLERMFFFRRMLSSVFGWNGLLLFEEALL